RRMTRLPLTADSDCPHCQGSGVVRVEVYVPVELLRVGDHVPRERKLCRCVGATQPVSDAYRSTNRQGLRGGFDGFANGDAVVASMLPGGNPVPGVVVGKHPDYLVVCFPQLGELVVVFEAELLTVT